MKITDAHLKQIYAHAKKAYPAECVGFLLGNPDDGDRTLQIIPGTNLNTERNDRFDLDPKEFVQVEREAEYYERQSQMVSTLIRVLGFLVAFVMAIGAVFGALNTMYSAVAARAREIATMRALGFGGGSVILSFMFESLLISLIGGVLGCIAALPVNGFTAGTVNWQTFSHLAFAFRVTPSLLVAGIIFALLMGIVGGVLPAVRAARMKVAHALREL